MNAAKLIEILQTLPPETAVLVHDDGDGGYGADRSTPDVFYSATRNEFVLAVYGFEYSSAVEGFQKL